jgi:hypothetical protein
LAVHLREAGGVTGATAIGGGRVRRGRTATARCQCHHEEATDNQANSLHRTSPSFAKADRVLHSLTIKLRP